MLVPECVLSAVQSLFPQALFNLRLAKTKGKGWPGAAGTDPLAAGLLAEASASWSSCRQHQQNCSQPRTEILNNKTQLRTLVLRGPTLASLLLEMLTKTKTARCEPALPSPNPATPRGGLLELQSKYSLKTPAVQKSN